MWLPRKEHLFHQKLTIWIPRHPQYLLVLSLLLWIHIYFGVILFDSVDLGSNDGCVNSIRRLCVFGDAFFPLVSATIEGTPVIRLTVICYITSWGAAIINDFLQTLHLTFSPSREKYSQTRELSAMMIYDHSKWKGQPLFGFLFFL